MGRQLLDDTGFEGIAGAVTKSAGGTVNSRPSDENRLVTPAEAAQILGVDQVTVTRWAELGRITPIRLEGGQPRYMEADVRALKATIPQQRGPAE